MNTERPTPRTDAAAWTETNWANAVVAAEFARQLERELAEVREELDRRHKEYATALNRRVDVENTLAQVAAGKRDMLTREECRELAVKLGVPSKNTSC